jgi:hypothetical protein
MSFGCCVDAGDGNSSLLVQIFFFRFGDGLGRGREMWIVYVPIGGTKGRAKSFHHSIALRLIALALFLPFLGIGV